jgi:transcriptional regulator with XRE-family HTH domain/Zn-dependent peptidase ImmA (M78 family)
MIRNERQYRTTLRQRQLLAEALDELTTLGTELPGEVSQRRPAGRDAQVLELQRASLAGQLADLDAQVHEYEQLRAGQLAATRVASLSELPDALVRARIAAGMSQRELAGRLGMKEQQVQRYEADGYAGASLSRLRQVMEALDLEFEGDVQLPAEATALSSLRRRLRALGFDRRTIDQRLLRDVTGTASQAKVLAAAERIARLLTVPVQDLLSPTAPMPAFATTARFQMPRSAAPARIGAYARYAESLADIVLRATAHIPARLPGDAQSVRTAIDEIAVTIGSQLASPHLDSEVLLTAALRYAASIGVPVLALRDPGAFHGACFSRDGRSVIVLKHASDSPARWLALLPHELGHLNDPSRGDRRTWIEPDDIDTWNDSPEEQRAHAFAADVLFYGRAAAVLTQAAEAAGGSVERLKAVVPQVAANADVPADVLANYLAFQLTRRGINWWGAASSFQRHGTPWRAVTDQLLTQLDFSALDPVDRSALMDALAA